MWHWYLAASLSEWHQFSNSKRECSWNHSRSGYEGNSNCPSGPEMVKRHQTIQYFQYPKRVSIFSIAPLTNIALAIKSFPEIVENINEVFIMGGSFKGLYDWNRFQHRCDRNCFSLGISGRGNIVPAAEFNFYKDPESVYIVLNSLKCPMTILPLDIDEHLHIPLV